jgi:hypothetical protein
MELGMPIAFWSGTLALTGPAHSATPTRSSRWSRFSGAPCDALRPHGADSYPWRFR